MIIITALTGPHTGKTRDATGFDDPQGLLFQFAVEDWKWSINWSRATAEEAVTWGVADMMARIVSALLHGRTVWFRDTRYRARSAREAMTVAQKVEDAIATCGYMVVVESDDEIGVRIGIGARMQ